MTGPQGHTEQRVHLELALVSQTDLDAAKPLIHMAYEGRGAAPIAVRSAP